MLVLFNPLSTDIGVVALSEEADIVLGGGEEGYFRRQQQLFSH